MRGEGSVTGEIKVPLARPTFSNHIIAKYKEIIEDILTTGRLTLGKYTILFEEKLAAFLNIKPEDVIVMNSCTAALHAIMMALKIRPGDEVIVPSYTFASTVNAPLYVGAKPVLVDSDLKTFNISIDAVLEKISDRTKAIIPVHIGGNPCDMKALIEIAEDHKLFLIEDAAHALGSYYNNLSLGTFGIASAFSFYPNKIITTGEGGAAVSKDKEVAKHLRLIRSVGREGLGPVEVLTLGHNFRMSELQAALGVLQLEYINKILTNRLKIAHYYMKELDDVKGVYFQEILPHSKSSYYAFIIRIDETILGITRDKLRKILLEKYGIETSILYKPVHLHKYFKEIFGQLTCLENSEVLGKETLALPIYGHMSINEAKYVVEAIKEIISG